MIKTLCLLYFLLTQGIKGDQGMQGSQGEQGATGFPGFPGVKGQPGQRGTQVLYMLLKSIYLYHSTWLYSSLVSII